MERIKQSKALSLIGLACLFLNSVAMSYGDFSGLVTRNGVVFYGGGDVEDRLYSYNSSTDSDPFSLFNDNDCRPELVENEDTLSTGIWGTPTSSFWEIINPDTSQFSTVYSSITTATVVGTGVGAEKFVVSVINLSDDKDTLVIRGDVTLFMEGDINIAGQGSLVIESDASLKIYSEHDISIAGNGVDNQSLTPGNFIVFGTAEAFQNPDSSYTYEQSIDIAGAGVLYGAFYAPNANLSISTGGPGGGFAGAVACNFLTAGGNILYSVDEDLAGLFPFGTSDAWNPFDDLSFGHQTADETKEFSVSWNSVYAATYQVQHTFSLDEPFQEITGAKMHGTGGTMTWSDSDNANSPQGYYRVTIKEIN